MPVPAATRGRTHCPDSIDVGHSTPPAPTATTPALQTPTPPESPSVQVTTSTSTIEPTAAGNSGTSSYNLSPEALVEIRCANPSRGLLARLCATIEPK